MNNLETEQGLLRIDRFCKRTFDMLLALLGLALTGWLIALAFILATADTKKNGFFTQTRVGENGHFFKVIKIRTMLDLSEVDTVVTTSKDPRITALGKFFRKTKIDELPQLINVLLGHMSFVGPRPDVPELVEELSEEDKKILLSTKPGITGPATLKYREEEKILARVQNPETYNKEVIFPDKVRINREYILHYSFVKDLCYIWQTVFGAKE